ncbi:MAG: hypothetical protein DRN66_01615 [Candidatus Nanohalarchaeota archaeon]|nr:MAG: hypothetical protein DRN66_01615 [Candidatus Nanohaloarchaeota archaeon]
MERIPEEGEYIIVKIKEISPNSAIVEIKEYNYVNGFVHLSEIANCWIKDIKKFIKPNQIKVAKVLRVDRHRSYINLSFKQVPVNISREREREYKIEQKANNLLRRFVEKNKAGITYEEIKKKLTDTFGSIKDSFEYLSSAGAGTFSKDFKLEKNFTEDLYNLVKKSIVKKQVYINANIFIRLYDSDGIEKIKEMLDIKEENVRINYICAPKYSIKITGRDYIECEKKFTQISKKILGFSNPKHNIINIERIKG